MAWVPNYVLISGQLQQEGQINVTSVPYVESSGYIATYGIVSSGETDNGDLVAASGGILISAGGTASGMTVNGSGAYLEIDGLAVSTTVLSGQVDVDSGGTASATTVYAGGSLNVGLASVSAGGMAIGTTLSGGALNVQGTGSASGITCQRDRQWRHCL
jgi:antigen 43